MQQIGDLFVGMCVLAPDGPRFTSAPMPDSPVDEDIPGSVPSDLAVRLYGAADAVTVYPGLVSDSSCTTTEGIALCPVSSPIDVNVRLTTPSGDTRVPPAPGQSPP